MEGAVRAAMTDGDTTGTECTMVLEVVRMSNFSNKAIKGRLLAFHQVDTLPQVTCERVS